MGLLLFACNKIRSPYSPAHEIFVLIAHTESQLQKLREKLPGGLKDLLFSLSPSSTVILNVRELQRPW